MTTIPTDSPPTSQRRHDAHHAGRFGRVALCACLLSAVLIAIQCHLRGGSLPLLAGGIAAVSDVNEALKVHAAAIGIHSNLSTLFLRHIPNLPTPHLPTFHIDHLPSLPDLPSLSSLRGAAAAAETTTSELANNILMFTAESAELAWETSESIFQHLNDRLVGEGGTEMKGDDGSKLDKIVKRSGKTGQASLGGKEVDQNGFLKAVGDLFQFIRKDSEELGGDSKEGRKVRMAKEKGQPERNHRRAKATGELDGAPTPRIEWGLTSVIPTPLAASIAAVCIFALVVFLFVSDHQILAVRSRRRPEPLEGRSIILDEEEAEIVEFYEKEMEAGMLIPFGDELEEEESESDEGVIIPSINRIGLGRSFSDSYLTHGLRSHQGHDRKDSRDSYYSTVLQDIENLNYDDDGDEQENHAINDDNCEQECKEDLCGSEPDEPNVDAVFEETEGSNEKNYSHCSLHAPTPTEELVQNEDPTPSKGRELEPLSPPSSTSSISSLTMENMECDVESQRHCFNHTRKSDHHVARTPPPSILSSTRYSRTSESDQLSPNIGTPTRSNTLRDQKELISPPKFERKVSFSPDVEVHRFSSQVDTGSRSSSEKYLYIVLLAIGIAIAIISTLPTYENLLSYKPDISLLSNGVFHIPKIAIGFSAGEL